MRGFLDDSDGSSPATSNESRGTRYCVLGTAMTFSSSRVMTPDRLHFRPDCVLRRRSALAKQSDGSSGSPAIPASWASQRPKSRQTRTAVRLDRTASPTALGSALVVDMPRRPKRPVENHPEAGTFNTYDGSGRRDVIYFAPKQRMRPLEASVPMTRCPSPTAGEPLIDCRAGNFHTSLPSAMVRP